MLHRVGEPDGIKWNKQECAPAHLAAGDRIGVQQLPHCHEREEAQRRVTGRAVRCGLQGQQKQGRERQGEPDESSHAQDGEPGFQMIEENAERRQPQHRDDIRERGPQGWAPTPEPGQCQGGGEQGPDQRGRPGKTNLEIHRMSQRLEQHPVDQARQTGPVGERRRHAGQTHSGAGPGPKEPVAPTEQRRTGAGQQADGGRARAREHHGQREHPGFAEEGPHEDKGHESQSQQRQPGTPAPGCRAARHEQ